MVGPQPADLVAEPRGLLVPLGRHSRLELGLQLDPAGLEQAPPVPGRHLADVPDGVVLHPLDERLQQRAEGL